MNAVDRTCLGGLGLGIHFSVAGCSEASTMFLVVAMTYLGYLGWGHTFFLHRSRWLSFVRAKWRSILQTWLALLLFGMCRWLATGSLLWPMLTSFGCRWKVHYLKRDITAFKGV